MKWRKTSRWIHDNIRHKGEDCLIWPFGRDSQGYGRATVEGYTTRLAHRIICEMVNGKPQAGQVARHLCGNGHLGCVNPNHLRWGTAADNSQDCELHGTKLLGEKVPMSVLTSMDIPKIRAAHGNGKSHRQIAAIYGVKAATIQAVLNGRTWGHVP